MSAAEDLLHDLVEHGVTIWQEAGQLRYRAPAGAVTPTMLSDIRQHKPELLALLAANSEQERCRHWQVTLGGKPLCTIIGESMTEAEALEAARRHWPDAEVSHG